MSVDHASAPLGEVGPDVEHRHGAADSRRHVVGVPVERPLQRGSARALHEEEVVA